MKKITKLVGVTLMFVLVLSGCAKENSENTVQEDIVNEVAQEAVEETKVIQEAEETDVAKTEETEIEEDELPNAFSFILDNIYDSLQQDPKTEEINCVHFSMGIREIVTYCETKEERMKAIGYCVKDVNEDGVKELLILDAGGQEEKKTDVLDMYTLVEGTPVKVIEGWARNRYYFLEDGMIYNSGSGGAAYSMENLLSFPQGGTELVPEEIYFTYPKNEDMSEVAFYYEENGVYDVSVAVEISSDEYAAFGNGCESKIVGFNVKTFDMYK